MKSTSQVQNLLGTSGYLYPLLTSDAPSAAKSMQLKRDNFATRLHNNAVVNKGVHMHNLFRIQYHVISHY